MSRLLAQIGSQLSVVVLKSVPCFSLTGNKKCAAKGRQMLAHPFIEVCSLVKEIVDDLIGVTAGCKDPAAQLAHLRQEVGKLTLVHLGVPSSCRVNIDYYIILFNIILLIPWLTEFPKQNRQT